MRMTILSQSPHNPCPADWKNKGGLHYPVLQDKGNVGFGGRDCVHE